jgi:quinol monooxygenase YgiN
VSPNTTVVVLLSPHPEHYSLVLELLKTVIPGIHKDPGCLTYALHERTDGQIVLVEKWRDKQAWLNHFSLPEIIRLKTELPPWLAAPAERLEMYEISGTGEVSG